MSWEGQKQAGVVLHDHKYIKIEYTKFTCIQSKFKPRCLSSGNLCHWVILQMILLILLNGRKSTDHWHAWNSQCSLEAWMIFRIAVESWDHTMLILSHWGPTLAWLFSSCNKSNVPGIIPKRQRQPGFTPLQPTRMSVRGSVSQTHTPFISPSSPMGAILWVKQRNSL